MFGCCFQDLRGCGDPHPPVLRTGPSLPPQARGRVLALPRRGDFDGCGQAQRRRQRVQPSLHAFAGEDAAAFHESQLQFGAVAPQGGAAQQDGRSA